MRATQRLTEFDRSLSPQGVVLRWIATVQGHPTTDAYIDAARGTPGWRPPFEVMRAAVDDTVRRARAGQAPGEIAYAVRQARGDVLLLFHLALGLNRAATAVADPWKVEAAHLRIMGNMLGLDPDYGSRSPAIGTPRATCSGSGGATGRTWSRTSSSRWPSRRGRGNAWRPGTSTRGPSSSPTGPAPGKSCACNSSPCATSWPRCPRTSSPGRRGSRSAGSCRATRWPIGSRRGPASSSTTPGSTPSSGSASPSVACASSMRGAGGPAIRRAGSPCRMPSSSGQLHPGPLHAGGARRVGPGCRQPGQAERAARRCAHDHRPRSRGDRRALPFMTCRRTEPGRRGSR